MIFPWQTQQWQQLWRIKQKNQLPQALLFAGMAGIGKHVLADHLSRACLCPHVDIEGLPCNQCHACRLLDGKVHPNILWVEPEKAEQAIKVEQIRSVNDFISQSSLQQGMRFVMIDPAHHMNINAANALLKTLEEPALGSMIILISDHATLLPKTILSRCQSIIFKRPKRDEVIPWLEKICSQSSTTTKATLLLKISDGAPLAALNLLKENQLTIRHYLFETLYLLSREQGDPIKAAQQLMACSPRHLLDFLSQFMLDLLRLQLGGSELDMMNEDVKNYLVDLKERTSIKNNVHFVNAIQQLRQQQCRGIHLNTQLMIESLLIRFMEYKHVSC